MPTDQPERPFWELRVHGVSDTPPESVLQTRGDGPKPPPIELVAGDETVGFYRYEELPEGADVRIDVEALSWGQLTSGRRLVSANPVKDLRRAGWSLLLPFALLNVALWARPEVSATPGDKGLPRALASLVRVMALTLTITLITVAAGFGMDLLTWQCRGQCDRNVYGLGFLASDNLLHNGSLPIIGALVPLALLGAIFFVVGSTFRYEAVLPAAAVIEDQDEQDGDQEDRDQEDRDEAVPHPMAHRDFWNGRSLVRSLRTPHLAVGLATIGHLLAASAWAWRPVQRVDDYAAALPDGPGRVEDAGQIVSVIALAALLLAVVAVIRAGAQVGPGGDTRDTGRLQTLGRASLVLAVVALLAGAVVAWFGNGPGDGSGWPNALPGMEATVRGLFLIQFLLLVSCWVVNAVAVSRAEVRRGGTPDAPAWNGLATTVFTGAGMVLGLIFGAAVLLGGAWWLNTGGDDEKRPLRNAAASATLQWAACGFAVGAAALVVMGIGFSVQWNQLRQGEYLRILDEEAGVRGNPHKEEAARQAAVWRALHLYSGYRAFRQIGGLAVGTLVALSLGAAVGLVNAVRRPTRPDPHLDWLISPQGVQGDASRFSGRAPLEPAHGFWTGLLYVVSDVGGYLAVATLLLFVLLIGALYRQRGARRIFGTVWDIATFWPRAAHPFPPPCYAEQVVPELATRIQGLPHRKLFLAGHSQGALLSAAALFMLNEERRRTIYFFTYGTQITRFYGRAFPAFFGRPEREALRTRMTRADVVRWRSFWRPTDPLGWPIDGDAGEGTEAQLASEPTGGLLDIRVRDPEGYEPTGGEVLDPKVRNHSDYPKSLRYVVERDAASAVLYAEATNDEKPPADLRS